MTNEQGRIFVVGTPIGNLEDITLRALRILKEADLIAAEDTRHSRKLLSHFGISTKLTSYYREKEHEKSEYLVQLAKEGKNIALISDAGMPGISDPGAILVRKAFEHGITVEPIPGVTALTTAMACAGITESGFVFHGFAPSKQGQRKKMLESIQDCEQPVVFYESPRRAGSLVQDILDTLGDRLIFIGRELTKKHEEFVESMASELLADYFTEPKKGEFVIVLHPGIKRQAQESDVVERVDWYLTNSTLTTKDISKHVAAELSVSKGDVYKLILERKK